MWFRAELGAMAASCHRGNDETPGRRYEAAIVRDEPLGKHRRAWPDAAEVLLNRGEDAVSDLSIFRARRCDRAGR